MDLVARPVFYQILLTLYPHNKVIRWILFLHFTDKEKESIKIKLLKITSLVVVEKFYNCGFRTQGFSNFDSIRIPWTYKYIDESPEVEPLAQYEQQLKNVTRI